MSKERLFIPSHGPEVTAVALGIEALTVLCEKYDANGLILIPALRNAPNTILSRVLSEHQVKLLAAGRTLKLSNGHGVSMCSPFTLKNHSSAPVVLALFASSDMIQKAEKARACKALLVVPWNIEDAELWVREYAPKILSVPTDSFQPSRQGTIISA